MRHGDILRMYGITTAGAGHTLPDLKALHTFTQLHDRAGAGITYRNRLVQAFKGRFDGTEQAVTAGFVHHLFEQIRPRKGFPQQGFTGELGQHTLGAGGDQRGGILHQHHTRFRGRHGNFHHLYETIAHVLQHLFHITEILPCV